MVDSTPEDPKKPKRPRAPTPPGRPKSASAGHAGNGSPPKRADEIRIPAAETSPPPKDDPARAAGPKPSAKPEAAPKGAEDLAIPDMGTFSRNMMTVAAQSQKLVSDFLRRQLQARDTGPVDPLNVGAAFLDLMKTFMARPTFMFEMQAELFRQHMQLWQHATRRMLGYDEEPVVEAQKGDKRFRHQDWEENAVFNYIKQSYLLTANWMQETVAKVEGLDDKTKHKINFYTRQFADAIAPTNFLLTNPEVLRETLKTNGENLVRGLENLLEDLERGKGQLQIRQTDMDYFKIGENIATAPGKVVYRNDLMELLQFAPTTKEVMRTPLLIFPPWINKYYILDLQPANSFIRWATAQGHTVFVASWVNPDKKLAQKTFEDYMREGILDGLKAVEKATGEHKVNVIGYCIGGTLLGATLAYMAAKGDDRVNSATFFAAQVDFSEAGDLQVFIDEEQLKSLEARMEQKGGYLGGDEMATTFNMLRANDLIWSYVVNNYMMGKDPMRFDLLYWNADTTRMPAKMHLFYLRQCYLENHLAKGDMVLGGQKLDLKKVKVPVFLQSSREDHIAPFKSVYKATKLYSGPVKFIVAGSGHIAGVINPPSANKYQHWVNEDVSGSIEDWWKGAKEVPGSWWPYWHDWISKLSGDMVPARVPGDGALKVIEDAPGSYVKIKAHE